MNEIRIEHLYKAFCGRDILKDISLTVPLGVSLRVTGPSGCGKTTLLRLLMGLEAPDSGSVTGMQPDISVVFQEDRLIEQFSALKNVTMTANITKDECRALLTELGLESDMDKRVHELSGGMRRRVAAARALAHRADIYLLDEPFAALDADTARLTAEVIRKYTREKTVIMTAHDISDPFPFDMEYILAMP